LPAAIPGGFRVGSEQLLKTQIAPLSHSRLQYTSAAEGLGTCRDLSRFAYFKALFVELQISVQVFQIHFSWLKADP
jgi:hypothetical protein